MPSINQYNSSNSQDLRLGRTIESFPHKKFKVELVGYIQEELNQLQKHYEDQTESIKVIYILFFNSYKEEVSSSYITS